jgi:hypothetical protein
LTVLVCQGLCTAFDVDYAQSDVRESDLPAGIESVAIRSTVPNRRCHAPQLLDGYTRRREPGNPRYATHWECSVEGLRAVR